MNCMILITASILANVLISDDRLLPSSKSKGGGGTDLNLKTDDIFDRLF